MANKEVQLKIRTAAGYDVLYPKTIISAVEGLSSALASLTAHAHADLLNNGSITSTPVAPTTSDAIVMTDASATPAHALKRGPVFDATHNNSFLRKDGSWQPVPTTTHTHVGSEITDASPVYYIAGNTGGTAGTWTGTHAGISSYYDGLTIAYKIGTAGSSTTTLNINSIGAVTCRFNTGNLTTHYGVNNVIILVYTTISSVGYWVKADYTDNTNNSQLWTYGPIAGAAITQYKIVMEGTDGKYYPLSIGDTTAATKTVATTQFKLGGYIFWSYTTASYVADATMNNYVSYTHITGSVFHYTTNQTTFTLNMPVYLVGTIQSNGSFVLNNATLTSWMTQTLPTTDDGFVYILLGMKVSSTANTYLTLTPEHTIYQYKNGALRIYEAPQSWSEITSKPNVLTIPSAPYYDPVANDLLQYNSSYGWITVTLAEAGISATHTHPYRADTWVPSWSDVQSKPTTFAPIIGSGAADAVAGNDSRLTNSRPASDVYAWAKAASKPSYAFSEITGSASASQIPSLDASKITTGTIDASRLPAITIATITTTAESLANHLVTSEYATYGTTIYQSGDIIISTLENKTYIHNGSASKTVTDFTLMATPTDLVSSVAGKTGIVTLTKGDVGLANVPNVDATNPTNIVWTATHRSVTDTEKSTWNAKSPAHTHPYRADTWVPTWDDVTGKPASFTPSSHSHTLGYYATSSSSDLNTTLGTGQFSWHNASTNTPVAGSYGQGLNIVSLGTAHNNTDNWITQLGFSTAQNTAYFRSKTNSGAWGSWYTFYHTGNKPTATDVGARSSSWVPTWSDVTNKPTTFAPIIGSGATDAVAGNDSRLTNSRPASDVYAWAKAATKPSYGWTEIQSKPTTFAPIIGTGAADAVAGNDARLTDARVASDVYAWAKAATKPSYAWSEIQSKPTTFAPIIGSGAADAVAGNDSRLSDARPASDVYNWAKASTKPTYGYGEVGAAAASHDHSGTYEPVITKGTTAQYFRGDMSLATMPTSLPASDVYNWAKASTKPTYSASEVGLGNVTNESKATMFTNAELTGTPTAPKASAGTNTTQIASTSFVHDEIDYRNGAQMGTDITTSTTFTTSHRNKFVRYTGASAGTLTIPLNTFNVGDEIHVLRYGAGEVTIARATSVSLYSEGSATENAGKKRINAQMQVVTMKCTAANVWVLFGALKT